MAKLILLSIVLVGILVPAMMATRPRPRRTLRTVQIVCTSFVVVWAYMCIAWYPQLVFVE
jgi:hypothetical protein